MNTEVLYLHKKQFILPDGENGYFIQLCILLLLYIKYGKSVNKKKPSQFL